MPRFGRHVPLTGMISAAVFLCGCQFIGGFAGNEIVELGGGGSGAGGSPSGGGDVGGQGGGPDECTLDGLPARPEIAETADDVTFILAARRIELGEDLDVALGLDIDEACTCSENDACP